MMLTEYQPLWREWTPVALRPVLIGRSRTHPESSLPYHVVQPLDKLLMTHMQDIGSWPDPWIYEIPFFTNIVLDNIADACPTLPGHSDLTDHGFIPVAWASGALVRSFRQPIDGHFDASRNAAKIRIDPKWLDDCDPIQRRAILKTATSPLDTDWRIFIGEESQKTVMNRLYRSVINHLQACGAKQRKPDGEHDQWYGFPTATRPSREGNEYERTLVHVEHVILDTGLPCILATYHLMRTPYYKYQSIVTPMPAGGQETLDFRLSDNQSILMRDMVPVVAGDNHTYSLVDTAQRDEFIQVRYSGPEHIPNPHYETLTQAIFIAMRMIRGNIEKEIDISRAVNGNIPITDLMTESTIRGLRSELRRLVQKELEGQGKTLDPFRIEEIIREGNLLSNLNPFRFVQMATAIGLLDIFVPGLGTLSEPYDWRTNPVAEKIIRRFKQGKHLSMDVFPECYFLRRDNLGFDSLGITMILGALDDMGLIPWWKDPVPYPGALTTFNLPGNKNPIAGGAKFFDYREVVKRIRNQYKIEAPGAHSPRIPLLVYQYSLQLLS